VLHTTHGLLALLYVQELLTTNIAYSDNTAIVVQVEAYVNERAEYHLSLAPDEVVYKGARGSVCSTSSTSAAAAATSTTADSSAAAVIMRVTRHPTVVSAPNCRGNCSYCNMSCTLLPVCVACTQERQCASLVRSV
jgi:hypothetical protein